MHRHCKLARANGCVTGDVDHKQTGINPLNLSVQMYVTSQSTVVAAVHLTAHSLVHFLNPCRLIE